MPARARARGGPADSSEGLATSRGLVPTGHPDAQPQARACPHRSYLTPLGLLLRVWLPGQLLRQRRDLLVLAAPGHAQQHGAESRGDVRGPPGPRTAHAPCMRLARAQAPSAESARRCNCYYCHLKRAVGEAPGRPSAPGRTRLPPGCAERSPALKTCVFPEPERGVCERGLCPRLSLRPRPRGSRGPGGTDLHPPKRMNAGKSRNETYLENV